MMSCNIKWLLISVICIILLSCEVTIEDYSEQLIAASYPGKYCKRYFDEYGSNDPLKLMSFVHGDIQAKWKFVEDDPRQDVPVDAEYVFRTNAFVGDCEDQAVVLAAVAIELGLKIRFCLSKKRVKEDGHIWLEVLIGDNSINLEKIQQLFPQTSIIEEDKLYWLAFIAQDDLKNYRVEYYVEVN